MREQELFNCDERAGEIVFADDLNAFRTFPNRACNDEIIVEIDKCQDSLQMNALRTNTDASSSEYIEQLIKAEEHEKKPGYLDRVKQLW